MQINKSLVRAIAESGLDFEDVAIFAGMLSNFLVRMVQGKMKPDRELKYKLSDILGKPVNELWPDKEE